MRLKDRQVKLLGQSNEMDLVRLEYKTKSGETAVALYERRVWHQAPSKVLNEMFYPRVANAPLTVVHPAETAGKTKRPRSAKTPRA